MNLVSIVVPVYNNEKYLKECLNSLINQTYQNLEIILVNGNSSDNSLNICQKFATLDNRIKIFNVTNQSTSINRNIGLKMSTGDYITFVDADDFIDSKFIEIMLEKVTTTNSELIISNITFFNRTKHYIKYSKMTNYTSSNINRLKEHTISFKYKCQTNQKYGPTRCIGGKLFKMDIIRKYHLLFEEEIFLFEDGIFILKYLDHIKTVTATNKGLYWYRQHNSSTSHTYHQNLLKQLLLINDKLRKICSQEMSKAFYTNCFEMYCSYIYKEFKNNNNYNNLLQRHNEIIKEKDFNEMSKFIKYRDLPIREKILFYYLKHNNFEIIYNFCHIFRKFENEFEK